MIDSNGIVKIGSVGGVIYGVSIGDLQTALGLSAKDIGQLISANRVSGESVINKWAKHKPFRNSAPGFALDRTQSTPEARSPQRMTQALAKNYGLDIQKFGRDNFKTHYADRWTYLRPRGLNGGGQGVDEFFRIPDFDGYLHNCYWQSGASGRNLYTIFNGSFSAADTLMFPGDSLLFEIQCCEDPDSGLPGLLYPYSFYDAMETSRIDISKYYMGIALLDASNDLWVITGDVMNSHISANDVYASLLATLPATFPQGEFVVIPVLASQVSNPDPQTGDARWTTSQQGYLVSLDGASITLRAGSAYGQLALDCQISVNGRYVTMDFLVRNITNSNVTVYGIDAYIMSGGAHANDPDSGYSAPAYVDPGVSQYIDQNWRSSGQVPASNPGYIYLTDWYDPSEYTPATFPEWLAARRYNPSADFYAANGNSYVVRPGASNQVTWQKVFDTLTGEDDFGAYSGSSESFAWVALCIDVGAGTRYVEEFINNNES